jgi:hypothetical protein
MEKMLKKDLQTEQLNFLIKDYEIKVNYLKDHFTRVWMRFNFFLTIQSALLGAFIFSPEKYTNWIPAFGIVVSGLWYIFGAQDRYLIRLYRMQVELTATDIKARLCLSEYYFVGQTEDLKGQPEKMSALNSRIPTTIYQWKTSFFSMTRIPALFPLGILPIWILILFIK